MKKTIEYYTCVATNDAELDSLVNNLIASEGYQPYGDPYTTVGNIDDWRDVEPHNLTVIAGGLVNVFAQAMVLYATE